MPLTALAAGLPDGSDGLRWQEPVARLPNAQKVAESPYYQCYRSGDGSAVFGGAPVANKRWCFAGDRLYFVQMEFSGQPAYERVLAEARSQWGEGRAGERFTETTVWGGQAEPVYVELEYSKIDQRGTLALVYLPVYRETQEASRQQRARARPGAGF
jgi:hypothetical protein